LLLCALVQLKYNDDDIGLYDDYKNCKLSSMYRDIATIMHHWVTCIGEDYEELGEGRVCRPYYSVFVCCFCFFHVRDGWRRKKIVRHLGWYYVTLGTDTLGGSFVV